MGSTLEFTLSLLNTLETNTDDQSVFHILALLKLVFPIAVTTEKNFTHIKDISTALLRLPIKASGNGKTFVTQSVLQTLHSLTIPHGELDVRFWDFLASSVLEIMPYFTDTTLMLEWLRLIASTFIKLAETASQVPSYEKERYPVLVERFLDMSLNKVFGNSTPDVVVEATVVALETVVREAVLDSMIDSASAALNGMVVNSEEAALVTVITGFVRAFSPRFQTNFGAVLRVVKALCVRVSRRDFRVVKSLFERVVIIRDSPTFDRECLVKKDVENVLVATLEVIGIGEFLKLVPLGLSKGNESKRPYLLPVISDGLNREWSKRRSTPILDRTFGNHELVVVVKEFLPLAKEFLEIASNTSGMEKKLYETLMGQVWALFPGICATAPRDVDIWFSNIAPEFGTVLQNVEMSSELKLVVSNSLHYLIDSYVEIAGVEDDDDLKNDEVMDEKKSVSLEDRDLAKKGLDVLRQYSTRFLNALCNCFTTIPVKVAGASLAQLEKDRVHYGNAIKSILKITDKLTILNYSSNLLKMLLQQQAEATTQNTQFKLRIHALLDLLTLITPYLPTSATVASPVSTIYNYLLTLITNSDSTVQKKAYKLLDSILIISEFHKTPLQLEELAQKLADPVVCKEASSNARRQRILLLSRLCDSLDTSTLNLRMKSGELLDNIVPRILPEIMFATKEPSEKTRSAAYECIIVQARKISECADVHQILDNAAPDQDMEVDEKGLGIARFVEMVAAGLESDNSALCSAAVACLGRLVFDFQEEFTDPQPLATRIITNVLSLLQDDSAHPELTNNREVIKSVLGFVKVLIVCIPQHALVDYVETIIISVLKHSRNNKSHFKVKARHILERLVRRFGFDNIEKFVPETDKKLMNNIRKRRDRAARKKREEAERDADDDVSIVGAQRKKELGKREVVAARQRAYEDAVYGSESELDSDGDDILADVFESSRSKDKREPQQHVIRETKNDVLDFLGANVVSSVSSTKNTSKKTASSLSLAKSGVTFSKDGKMQVVDVEKSLKDVDMGEGEGGEAPTDWYKEAITGEAAFTRLPDGSIKFLHKDIGKKRVRDDEIVEEKSVSNGIRKNEKRKFARHNLLQDASIQRQLGRQFKAKKAEGDIKKAGMPDPFAYIPLDPKTVGGKRKATKLVTKFKTVVGAARFGDKSKAKITKVAAN
ncbi:hypothetical protein HK096_002115, partial [Nowakowskiella sp. JEL0078]